MAARLAGNQRCGRGFAVERCLTRTVRTCPPSRSIFTSSRAVRPDSGWAVGKEADPPWAAEDGEPHDSSIETSTRPGKSETTIRKRGFRVPLRAAREKVISQAPSVAILSSACSCGESPARPLACATTASTAAINRASRETSNSTRDGSALIGIGEPYVARLAAIRAVVEAVDAEMNVGLGLAIAAVLIARALLLGLVALRTERSHGNRSPVFRPLQLNRAAFRLHTRAWECASQDASPPYVPTD